jgi:hypothetical protein
MSELTPEEQARFLLPPHGRWFAGTDSQKLMLEVYHEAGGLALSWDSPGGNGKMFGVYPPGLSRSDFMHLLLDIPLAHRNAYEMLVENVPCRAYVDAEWQLPADPDHTMLKGLVAAIRSKVVETYSVEPRIFVCCGTRALKGDLFKHSYHIVLENLVFERNNDGLMKAFFSDIHGFTWTDANREEKDMIDTKVYTKNRHFRLPHSCKSGTKFPLLRISGDPLLDEFVNHDWGRDVQAILPFFISNPDQGDDCFFVSSPQVAAPVFTKGGSSIKRARMTHTSSSGKVFPVPIQIIQRLLQLAGDNKSTLASPQYLPEEDKWKIQCDQHGQGRKCLFDPAITHDSNNALLFIERFESGFRVEYQCMSSECSSYAKPILGYISMNAETVEWQIALTLPDQEVPAQMMDDTVEDQPSRDQEMLDLIDPPNDPDNPDLNTYEMVRARFELSCFKVRVPFCYARIEKDHDPCLHSHVDLQHYYCDWKFWGPNKDGDIVKLSFIAAWLQDPDKRVVDRIVVDPANTIPNVYNMWRGFDAEKLGAVPVESIAELVQPITKHFDDVVTLGESQHTEFIHHYLANMLQRPWLKSQVAISLYGAQGCGKGIIFEFFRQKILGSHCSYQTSKPENDLFGRFANGAVNRVCIQIDEVKSLHDHADQLKDFITNPTVNYEKKGRDTIVVSNFANLIMTSNNANALTVSSDDRRFALFHCSSVHKGDVQYFNELGAHLERPDVARAYYQYLMSLDLSDYPTSFQHRRPITEYYKEAQHNSIPVISRFFSAMVNAAPEERKYSCRQLYKSYETFQIGGNYKFLMTETAFGRETKKIKGVASKRTDKARFYILDLVEIQKYLEEMNEFDHDAIFY